MSQVILKKSSVANKVPLPADLVYGELALNYADGLLYFKTSTNSIGVIGGASSITNTQITNWTAAYNWGDHSLAGYLTSISGAQVTSALGFTPYNATNPSGFTSNTGTVTSVLVTVPTGLTATNTAITTSGTIAIGLDTGYSIPTTVKQTNWDTAYTNTLRWDGGATGLVAATGRTSLGLVIGTNVQAWDADLDAIASLAATSGFLKKTAANAWTLDTNTYITGNQSITVSGDATGTGATSIALTLAASGVTAGTYTKITVDAKGRATAGTTLSASDIPTLNQNTTGSSGSCTGNAATATTATNQSGGTVSATTGSFSGVLSAPKIYIARSGGAATGITWYSTGYSAWTDYMSPAAAAGSGPMGNITAPSGSLVTSWALRRFVENAAGYGWTWESGSSAQVTPTVVAEILASDGSFRSTGNITAYSDERKKTNWRPVKENFVELLAGVKHGIYDRTDVEITQAGVSAQSWQQVLAETVTIGGDSEKTLSVSYGNAALVSAVQLAKRVIEQDARIAKLEALISKLIEE